jgi:hypothetical protein
MTNKEQKLFTSFFNKIFIMKFFISSSILSILEEKLARAEPTLIFILRMITSSFVVFLFLIWILVLQLILIQSYNLITITNMKEEYAIIVIRKLQFKFRANEFL